MSPVRSAAPRPEPHSTLAIQRPIEIIPMLGKLGLAVFEQMPLAEKFRMLSIYGSLESKPIGNADACALAERWVSLGTPQNAWLKTLFHGVALAGVGRLPEAEAALVQSVQLAKAGGLTLLQGCVADVLLRVHVALETDDPSKLKWALRVARDSAAAFEADATALDTFLSRDETLLPIAETALFQRLRRFQRSEKSLKSLRPSNAHDHLPLARIKGGSGPSIMFQRISNLLFAASQVFPSEPTPTPGSIRSLAYSMTVESFPLEPERELTESLAATLVGAISGRAVDPQQWLGPDDPMHPADFQQIAASVAGALLSLGMNHRVLRRDSTYLHRTRSSPENQASVMVVIAEQARDLGGLLSEDGKNELGRIQNDIVLRSGVVTRDGTVM